MGNKRVTSQDVARRAGVSRTTVSLVLNDVRWAQISQMTRHRVLQAAKELGYVPDAAARALASRRSQIIGLLLTRSPRHIASDTFLPQSLYGLIQVVRDHGWRLMIDIIEPQHQRGAYLQMARAKHIDGILLSGPRYDDEALQALEDDGFPTVLMGQLLGSSFYSVDVDNRNAARQAVSHLVNIGHRMIACITNTDLSYTAAFDRLTGYREALEDAAIPYNQVLVRYGDFDLQSGYVQMQSLLADEVLPSAVFVASDAVAMGAMAAIRERGLRIPQDIALVGFDDLPLAQFVDPPLTTIHVPAIELACKASEMLLQLLQGSPPSKKHVILDAHLVVRESCGALMAHG